MRFRKISLVSVLALAGLLLTCTEEAPEEALLPHDGLPFGTAYIPSTPQRSGNPEAGYQYLIYGDYMNSGIPYEAYIQVIGPDNRNLLNRTGDNAVINYEITAVNAPNGVRIVAQNCLKCHADRINGEFMVGLGAASYDYTFDHSLLEPATTNVIQFLYGAESPEFEAYEYFRNSGRAIGPYLVTEVRGVNPADKIWTILAAHRDQMSLDWDEQADAVISNDLIPPDVPPWWNLKKKNAMFYSTYGRGDFSRIMMASSLLTLEDSSRARVVDGHFNDVLAYLKTLEPPAYPWPIDEDLAAQGLTVYKQHCAFCHGTYEEIETFPNLLVSLARLGTDPELAFSYYNNSKFLNWFNNGWFGQDPHGAQLQANKGYIAPPLDGVWATAPYLHNGSIPTLDDLLNSPQRPAYWRRSFNTMEYDTQKVGWLYEVQSSQVDKKTYDVSKKGYSNAGHIFGDLLPEAQRKALLEYLKTL
jgi:mono/diheme cytochrome c family protein